MGETIVLIGGGPSAKNVDFAAIKPYATIVGCNDAAVHAPVDIIFSVDGRWMKNRIDFWTQFPGQKIFSRHHFTKWVKPPWPCDIEVTLIPTELEGQGFCNAPVVRASNSGFAALNWAYHKRPKNIFLFGYDANSTFGEYWYPRYEWRNDKTNSAARYQRWADEHILAAKVFRYHGIKVYNVSETSSINCYRRTTYEQFKDYLRQLPRVK